MMDLARMRKQINEMDKGTEEQAKLIINYISQWFDKYTIDDRTLAETSIKMYYDNRIFLCMDLLKFLSNIYKAIG